MEQSAELLHYICENSKIGIDTSKKLIDISNSMYFKNILEDKLCDYADILKKASEELENFKAVDLPFNHTYKAININVPSDKSNAGLSQLLINESKNQIVNIKNKIEKYTGKDKKPVRLANKLLSLEKNNIEDFHHFIK